MASNGESGGNPPTEQNRDKPWLNITQVQRDLLEGDLEEINNDALRIVRKGTATEAHTRLEQEIPRPDGQPNPTAYVTLAAGNGNDVTDFVPQQAYASEKNLPRLLRLMERPRDHPEYQEMNHMAEHKKKEAEPSKHDLPVVKVWMRKANGELGEQPVRLKNHPILPNNISSQVEGWRMLMWLMYDHDIQWNDIFIRIKEEFRKKHLTTNFLQKRVATWREMSGGQFSKDERVNQTDASASMKSDLKVVGAQFKQRPEAVQDDGLLEHFNTMARQGDLNKVYWNTPWKIFKHKDDQGELRFLVQQNDPQYKDIYFEADTFDSNPANRERLYRALWQAATTKVTKKRPNGETDDAGSNKKPKKNKKANEKMKGSVPNKKREIGELDDFQESNFQAIATLMRRLNAEHMLLQESLDTLNDEYDHGLLIFGASFPLKKAKTGLRSVLRMEHGEFSFLGLNRKVRVNDNDIPLGHNPKDKAEVIKHTIVDAWTEYYEILKKWDPEKTAGLKFSSIKKGDATDRSVLVRPERSKDELLRDIVQGIRTQNNGIPAVDTSIESAQENERPERFRLSRLALERCLRRALDMIEHHAESLEWDKVYLFDSLPSKAVESTKYRSARLALLTLENLLAEKLHNLNPAMIKGLIKPKINLKSPSTRLKEVSLTEYREKREETKKQETKDTEKPGEGNSPSTATLPSQAVGESPRGPYAKFDAGDQLDRARLNQELDRVVQKHGNTATFTAEQSFVDRLHHVVNTLDFEDVMGHYRIATPVLHLLREDDESKLDGNERHRLAMAVDTAMLRAVYIGQSLAPQEPEDDDSAFPKRVADELQNAMEPWVAQVRFTLVNNDDYDKAHPP